MRDEIKVYPNRDNSVFIVCPHCNTDRVVNASKMRKCGHRVRLKCACGGAFSAFVECRRAYRKETTLMGFYKKLADGEDQGEMTIKNISLLGVGFTSRKPHTLKIGDEVLVEFTLDDAHRSKISKRVVVKCLGDDYYVGCQFGKPAHAGGDAAHSDKAIGFYVMP